MATGISVLVLTYQHGPFILKCLQGIANQRYKGPIDVIIADDASTDNTAELAAKFIEDHLLKEALHMRFTLLRREKNLGPAANFAEAIGHCIHPYLAFCEGDDFWTANDKLSRQAAQLDLESNYTMSFTNYALVDSAGCILKKQVLANAGHEFNLRDLLFDQGPSTNAVMLRRKLMPKEFPKRFFEVTNPDVFIFALALMQGPAVYLPEVCSNYRLHEGGIWSSLPKEEQHLVRIHTRLMVIESCIEELISNVNLLRFRDQLRDQFREKMSKLAMHGDPLYDKFAHVLPMHRRMLHRLHRTYIRLRQRY